MRILFDLLTPKQARMAVAVWNRFSQQHEISITSRNYAETNDVLTYYKVPFESHGDFHQQRQKKFAERLGRLQFLTEQYSSVDVIITQASIEAVHMGAGLGIPVVLLIDSPKRKYLNRQIIPASSYHLREELTRNEWEYEPEKPVYMDATQEHFYTKSIKRKNPNLIVFRNFEYQASYAKGQSPPDVLQEVKRYCSDHGYDLLELERYQKHEFVPPERIFEKAILVITGGSSMAIEAAIQQIPAISFYPGYFPKFEYLMELGYPLARVYNVSDFKETMTHIIDKKPPSHQFKDNPLEKLAEILQELQKS